MTGDEALFEWLLRQGDNALILGHRLSEWCGRAPMLEEDIALANTALDFIGQAQLWLGLAAEVEDKGRSADDLAFLRDVWDFRNLLLVERPNVDFGHTIMRQFLFDAFNLLHLEALRSSSDERVAAIAEKASKEAAYHLERSGDVVVALGDGTEESHSRMQTALDALWPYTGELFSTDAVERGLAEAGLVVDPSGLRDGWNDVVRPRLADATLTIPQSDFAHQGGKTGTMHSEHLGHLLSQMQWLQRAYPGASW